MYVKRFQKYVKKEWGIKMSIKPDDTLIKIAELITMKKENKCYEEIYNMWIISESYKLPHWVCVTTIIGFLNYMKSDIDPKKFNPQTTLNEIFEKLGE